MIMHRHHRVQLRRDATDLKTRDEMIRSLRTEFDPPKPVSVITDEILQLSATNLPRIKLSLLSRRCNAREFRLSLPAIGGIYFPLPAGFFILRIGDLRWNLSALEVLKACLMSRMSRQRGQIRVNLVLKARGTAFDRVTWYFAVYRGGGGRRKWRILPITF